MDNMYMEHVKSWEDQMDLMTMMMQLPDSSVANNGVVGHLPPEDFSCSISSGSSIHGVMPHFVDNPHVASSSFSNSGSTTISFGDDNPTPLLQDQVPSAFPPNSSNKKWGADAELSGSGNDYSTSTTSDNDKRNSMAAMREMIFRIAAMQPIYIDPESVKPPKRKNVKISKDPQSVAARHRRERISERIRILQRLVPGGTKMDTASMLDEAIHYVKFLKTQVQSLERAAANRPIGIGFPVAMSSGSYHSLSMAKANYCYQAPQNFHHYRDA